MDFFLIILGIGGLVFAGVMLVLASRATRMERESDARVDTLRTMATGSVLFAADGPAESSESDEMPLIDTFRPLEAAPVRLQFLDRDLDLAWDELPDEKAERAETPVYPFVLTVPVAAGQGRVFSFERAQRGRRR